MYKVFFVDDEAAMRTGIRNNINWDDSNFTLTGEAPDGELALSLMQEIMPDILITDVRMPFMDGIELSRIIKKTMPWIKIIILSGHDEFEYAKQAITIGVEEYLLKPVTSEKLMEVLNEVAIQIEDEKQKLQNLERLIVDTKKVKVERLLSDLLYGNINVDKALITIEEFDLSIVSDYYLVMLIHIHISSSESYNSFQLAYACTEAVLNKWAKIIFFRQGSDKMVCVLKGKDEATLEEYAYICAQAVKHEIERNVDCSVSIAIGSIVSKIEDWSKSLANADMAKQYLDLANKKQIISTKDINISGLTPFAEIKKLPTLDKLRYTSKADINKFLEDYFNNFGASSRSSFMFMNYAFVDILIASSMIIEELSGDISVVISEYSNINSMIASNPSIENITKVIITVLERMIDFRDSVTCSKYGEVISKAQEYIRQNFKQQGISLHSVSKEVNISPNHFSTIFSQETGETFINYITKVRIEEAKNLLRITKMRTSDIAYEVGYNDTHYFSYVFKKNVGMTPKDFRK